jgi:nicotinate phosphoribosyltransferase
MKLSSGKKTLVASKQVFRKERNGRLTADTIGLREEMLEGEPLLRKVMRDGIRTGERESLDTIRSCFKEEFEKLAPAIKSIKKPQMHPVDVSDRLERLQQSVKQCIIERELGES